MGPFSVFTVFVGVISCSWCGVHGKIGNFIIVIISLNFHTRHCPVV